MPQHEPQLYGTINWGKGSCTLVKLKIMTVEVRLIIKRKLKKKSINNRELTLLTCHMFAASALINQNKSSWDEFPDLRLPGHRVHTAITKQMKKIPGFAQSFRLIHSPFGEFTVLYLSQCHPSLKGTSSTSLPTHRMPSL